MILGLWVGLVLARSEAVEISMRNLCGEPVRSTLLSAYGTTMSLVRVLKECVYNEVARLD